MIVPVPVHCFSLTFKKWVGFMQLCNLFIDAIEGKKLETNIRAFAFRRLKTAVATMLETYRAQIEQLKSDMFHQEYELIDISKYDMSQKDEEAMTNFEQYLEDFQEKRCSAKLNKHKTDRRHNIKRCVNDVFYHLNNIIKEITEELERRIAAEKPTLREIVKSNKTLVESIFVCKVLSSVSDWIDCLSCDQQTSTLSTKLAVENTLVSLGKYYQSPGKQSQAFNQAGKRYDFFVLHSDADNDCVICCLLQQLEYGQFGFKGKERVSQLEE